MTDSSNLDRQLGMLPATFAALLDEGLVVDAPLTVEFFFFATERASAESLHVALRPTVTAVGVDEVRQGLFKKRVVAWSVTGSATVVASETALKRWITDMVVLGERHQSEFDGWGASV